MKIQKFTTRIAAALLLTVLWVGIPVPAHAAEDRLAHIFQDNMVLQREKPVPVWGWAKPGTQVEVRFGGQKKSAAADAKGYWKAILDPMPANRTAQTLDVRIGGTTISRKNVLVGEVWVVIGASNTSHEGPDMDTGVYPHYISPGTKGGKPEIRSMVFGFGASLEPYADVDPSIPENNPWTVFQEDPPPALMGPAFYFARVVRDGLDVPVGIIRLLLVTATGHPTWTSKETLESLKAVSGNGNFYDEFLGHWKENLAKSRGPIKTWEDFKKAENEWRTTKKGGWPGSINYNSLPTGGYNTRIFPLAPFVFRGAFYNVGDTGPWADGAAERIVAMVKQWRQLFGQDFYFINSTFFRYTTVSPPLTPSLSSNWVSGSSEAIRKTLKLFGDDKKVAVVEMTDTGDWITHFLQKCEMGRRLGLAALTVAYGQNHIYTGPRMAETKITGNKATVRFEQVGDGLLYQPSIDGISGIYLRGKTGPSRWAQVKVLSKDTIEISHPDIANIEMVAYGNNENPHETLFNSGSLPASPFAVNPFKASDPQQPFEILSMQDSKKNQGLKSDVCMVSLAHVRRSGYVFQVVPKEKEDPGLKAKPGEEGETQTIAKKSIQVQAYIPAEWKGYEVESGGKKLNSTETTKDGARFVTLDAPADRSWIIVSETGKAAEFRKVNRY